MSHTSNTINAPVTMPDDIAAVLSISGTDLQEICQSPAINMWAKFKPIARQQKEILTDAQRASQNYGLINIPTWSNINKMANFWLGIDTSDTNAPDCGKQPAYWAYQRPSSYFRLSDFSNEGKTLGYFHSAEAPIGNSLSTEYTISGSGYLRINYASGHLESRTIALADLSYPRALSKSIGNMYFGVMLYNVSSGNKYVVTQTTKVSELGTYGAWVEITGLTQAFNGTYKIFPFISADQIPFTSETGQMTNGDYIALQEPEVVGIGTTIVRMNILDQSLNAFRNTAQSTRLLYLNITLLNNAFEGTLGASVKFDVYNASDVFMKTHTVTVADFPADTAKHVSAQIDMSNLLDLRAAYSVRATVTPNYGINRVDTTAVCLVTDGPTPAA